MLEKYFSPSLSVSPRLFYQKSSFAKNRMIQVISNYHLNQSKDFSLQFCGGLRLEDAAQLIFGLEFKNWKGGISNDISNSDLAKAGNRSSGIEIGLMYKHHFPVTKKELPIPEPIVEIEEVEIPVIPVKPPNSLNLWIRDSIAALPGTILLLSTKDETINTHHEKGSNYTFDIENNRTYQVIVEKPGYISDTSFVFTTEVEKDTIISREIELQFLPKQEPIKVELGKPVRLNNIYYNLNDYRILLESEEQLPILYRAMNTYTDMEIEISSHTDS